MLRSLAWAALLLPTIALGALYGRGESLLVRAVRTTDQIHVDGRMDETAWLRAPAFTDFLQSFPEFGAAPTRRTTVRVLYDNQFIYVGFVCDAPRDEIVRRLTRRDSLSEVDLVSVAIDSAHDHRTAYKFQISAAGVKKDSLHFDDYRAAASWDEVWDAAVAEVPGGWSAEFAIPLGILPFSSAREQTWGISLGREIPALKETINSVPIGSNVNADVSLYGHLTGLVDLKPPLRLELVPFVAMRGESSTDDSSTQPRLTLPSGDLGADFKVGLSRSMTLSGTINPDFGQVEADAVQLNLTNFEIFFPEKRPFFMQGMSIFQSIGSDESSPSPQSLFYSRRIGLDSPILGAVKLSGNPSGRVEIGVLDAVVAGAGNPESDSDRDLTAKWNLVQPLHLGPRAALPKEPPIPMNYATAVARASVLPRLTIGPTFSAATPLTRPCTDADAALPPDQRPQRCSAIGANVAGFEWNLASSNGDWGFWGQLAGSQAVGGAPRTLRDGTVIRPREGTTGGGLYFTAGKLGGDPWRLTLTGEYESPTLDVNPTGFQQTQNHKSLEAQIAYARSREGPFRKLKLSLTGNTRWTTDGREIPRGNSVSLKGEAYIFGYQKGGVSLTYEDPRFDVREIRRTRIPLEKQKQWAGELKFETDDRKPVQVGLEGEILHSPAQALLPSATALSVDGSLTVVPAPWLRTELEVEAERNPQTARWTETSGTDLYFAGLRADSLSVTLKQLVAFSPNLSFQLYTQLFNGYGIYGPFYRASASGVKPIHIRDLQPTTTRSGEDDFRVTAWNVSAVLRWEYRLGSAFYLAYTRSQEAIPVDPTTPLDPNVLQLRSLGRAEIEDVLLLKWTYWWGG